MSVLDKVVEFAKKASPVAPDNQMGKELASKKATIKEYTDAVGGPEPSPKASPPQAVDKIHGGSAKYGSKPGESPIDPIDLDKMRKPLGQLKDGTPSVPKTGIYKLHKGEAVTPAKDNMAAKSLFDMVPGRGSDEKPPKKEIKTMEHRKSSNGKHIVVHKHHSPAHHPDEEHVMNDMAELHKHMDDHAGTPNEGEAAPTGPDAPAPLTAAPSPAGAPPATPMPGA